MFLPHPRVKVSIMGSFRDREVACSASDRQCSNFEICVWRTVSSQSSHHPQEVLLAQFSLYVHKGGLKPDSFHFISFISLTFHRNTRRLLMFAPMLEQRHTPFFLEHLIYLAKVNGGRMLCMFSSIETPPSPERVCSSIPHFC